jgi:CDP-diglyceride synthetase
VDDAPDGGEDEVTRTDLPVTRPEPAGPTTGQVRIFGADQAGEVTGELPRVSPTDPADDEPATGQAGLFDDEDDGEPSSVRLVEPPAGVTGDGAAVRPVGPGQTAVPTGTPTELPHWTEPPTGQIPAVLARDTGEEGSGIEGPSWREEDADWVAHEELFDPAMFGDDEVALGSLDETDRTDVERRPWEFDLEDRDVDTRSSASEHPITEPVPVVSADDQVEPAAPWSEEPFPTGAPTQVVAATGRASTGPSPSHPEPDPSVDDVVPEGDLPPSEHAEPSLPTGTERMGRTRRSGLLTTRLRARRPGPTDDLADSPLAAEPPGASVADVPGAGRKKLGVAGLAAADRTAEREAERTQPSGPEGSPRYEPLVTGAAAGATVLDGGRRRGRRSANPRMVGPGAPDAATAPTPPTSTAPRPAPAAGSPAPTGGGPPAPERARPPRPGTVGAPGSSSIGLRVGTGVAVAVVALLAFRVGTVASLVLVTLVVTFAAGECFGVLRRAGYHPATLLGLVGTVSLIVGAYAKGIAAVPLVLALIVAFTLLWYLFGIERGSPVAGTAATLLTVGWVSLLGSYAGLLLSPSAFPDRHGIAFLLGAIIATVANDVGALLIGGWLGRTPLAPTISPNKTWEGLLGGTVITILVSAVVVGQIHPWSVSNAALLGVVVSVVAPLGDLCESLLKRDLKLKDMGTLLPGHGGVLDRVDALLFVLPATYYLVRALNIA